MASNLGDTNRLAGRVKGTGNDNSGDVVDRNHVDGVVDVRPSRELDASLDQADEEIIRVRR